MTNSYSEAIAKNTRTADQIRKDMEAKAKMRKAGLLTNFSQYENKIWSNTNWLG